MSGFAFVAAAEACSGPATVLTPQPAPAPVAAASAPAEAEDVFAAGSGGIVEWSPSGAVVSTFATGYGFDDAPGTLAIDRSGNVYALTTNAGLVSFAVGAAAPQGTYVGSSVGPPDSIEVTPQGVLIGVASNLFDVETFTAIDEWYPGVTGGPSSTIDYTSGIGNDVTILPAVGPDGTLYVAHSVPGPTLGTTAGVAYDAFAPGSTTPERAIADTHGAGFVPSAMAAGSDGTLYVAEWNGTPGDPLAGIYVYPPAGAAKVVRSGAPAPVSICLDTAGKVYVLNDDSVTTGSSSTPDTVHLYSVYAPGMTALLERVSTGFVDGRALTVSSDGSRSYFIGQPSPGAAAAIMEIAASARAASVFADVTAGNVALFGGSSVAGGAARSR